MEHLQEVRAKVIEAVPEIVELKPGCLFKFERNFQPVVLVAIKSWEDGNNDIHWMALDPGSMIRTDFNQSNKAVSDLILIGRPITLADVLRAIGKEREFAVYESGALYHNPNASAHLVWGGVNWDFALPLDEQEPKVIEFLHKILCV